MHLGTRYPSSLAEEAGIEVLRAAGFKEGKCVFLSSGSESVEFGVQTALRFTEKPLLLGFKDSYLAAYGTAGNKKPEKWVLLDWNSCAPGRTDEFLKEVPFDSAAAFVFEPGGSGEAFVKFPPKQLVREIAGRIKKAGGLLGCMDSIFTNMAG